MKTNCLNSAKDFSSLAKMVCTSEKPWNVGRKY
jgi:hypothetical protein